MTRQRDGLSVAVTALVVSAVIIAVWDGGQWSFEEEVIQ